MSKRVYNCQLMKKLKEIEQKIEYRSKIGRSDNIFALGTGLSIASIPMFYIEGLRDSYTPYLFIIVGLVLMIGSNIWRERIKKR